MSEGSMSEANAELWNVLRRRGIRSDSITRMKEDKVNYGQHVQKASASFFGKQEDTESHVQLPKSLTNDKRKFKSGSDQPTIKDNLNLLTTGRNLDTKKGYNPPPDTEARVKAITAQHIEITGNVDWTKIPITDSNLKFKILTQMIQEFDHDMPNTVLTSVRTIDDVLQYYMTEVKRTHRLEDLSKLDLPKNLNVQLEYLRFNPETDTMFQGRTAFPGRDTIVTSIKYKRKYSDIKTTKEKAGYVNHYYEY